MKHRVKTILFIGLALIALFGMIGCKQASSGGGGNSGGETPPTPKAYPTAPASAKNWYKPQQLKNIKL